MATSARGTARLLLAFVVGSALTLTALRYIPRLAEQFVGSHSAVSTVEPTRPGAATASAIAGRLSYELSSVPADAHRAVSERGVSAAPPKRPVADITPGEYVANARPITTSPPDPRDRTPEIQKESRSAQTIRTNPRQRDVEQTP
jgi:hypothetical protein